MKRTITSISLIFILAAALFASVNVSAAAVTYTVSTDRYYNGGEQATFTCRDEWGNVVWTYTTGIYPAGEIDRIMGLGQAYGSFYFIEYGTLKAVQLDTGWVRTVKNDISFDTPAEGACGNDWDGRLYFITWDRSNMYVIEPNDLVLGPYVDGTENYWHPYILSVSSPGLITVTYEDSASGEYDVPVAYDLSIYLH